MDFKNIPKKYRPIPFWSWNEKLDTEKTKRQIRMMDEAGIGGFFMHARGGLQTEYMSDEWFENVSASIDEGENCGMGAWAYDENGWPSGFGSGAVNGLGIEYRQKYLRMSDTEPDKNVICRCGSHWFYYEVNPFYVDTLDKKVIAEFIDKIYKPYYEKYGTSFEGFFTDEPQISRAGIPWSFVFEKEYSARYSKSIYDELEALFLPVGDYVSIRVRFWKMVTDLFSEAYMKQIGDKCREWGVKLTGHLVLEETPRSQVTSNGACMPHYEYMDIPGMDWLGRDLKLYLTPHQVSSVTEQLGIEQVLSETFAMCGHSISLAELKGIYEWQMVRGINLLCPHLEGYSMRGIRKRDYPPAMYYQQPWWSEYGRFTEAVSRIGMLLARGKKEADVLLIHPQTTAWTLYDDGECRGLDDLGKELNAYVHKLERRHIAFHLGDETMLERHGRIDGGKLVIGMQKYTYILNPFGKVLLPCTQQLLADFAAAGGKLVSIDDIPANDITDNPEITYKKSVYDEFTVHYFVNSSPERKYASFNVQGYELDIYTGGKKDFDGTHDFEPWGSLIIIEDGSKNTAHTMSAPEYIRPEGSFRIAAPVINALTLDRCDYYFDGVLQEKNGYVLNIAERANALGHDVRLHQDFRVNIAVIPDSLYMVCETPHIYEIKINGRQLNTTVCGWFVDEEFKKINITEYVKKGENVISFDCNFVQPPEFYENLKKSYIFESEKNKLVYDMETEAVYLIGDFGVKTDGEWEMLENNAVRYRGDFVIDAPAKVLDIKHIEQQGYPFFCGELCLEGDIDIPDKNAVLELDPKGLGAVRVEINGITRVLISENRLPLAQFGATGKTRVRFTLINNLRNLLGPHHLKTGDSHRVGPSAFFKEPCVWVSDTENWDDDYAFIGTGI